MTTIPPIARRRRPGRPRRLRPSLADAAARALLPLLAGAGCHAVGPSSIESGRSLYNEAIARTSTEQLLLNLVRLRYREVPIFLEVTSVSTTFSLQSRASAGLALGLSGDADGDELGLGAGVQLDERPTVTYLPLQGEAFATRLLTPVEPRVLVLLANSGWAIDRILMIAVQQLGPLENAPSASGPTPDAAPEFDRFRRLATAMRTLQREHALRLSVVRSADAGPDAPFLLGITIPAGAVGTPEHDEVLELLGGDVGRVAPDGSRVITCSLVAGFGGEGGGRHLPIVTRSLMSSAFSLSQAVEADAEHARRGLVTVTRNPDGTPFDWGELLGGVFRVRVGQRLPEDAGPAVRHRGRWYWIAESDLTSKSTVGLVQQLFALQAGPVDGGGPVLTLPLTGN